MATKIVRNIPPHVAKVLDEMARESGASTESFIRAQLVALVGERKPMDKKLNCEFCDQEVNVSSKQQERASGNVAFKRVGVKNPRKFYCASCTDDGSGYPSSKFEQA